MNRKPYRDILDSAAADSLSRHTDLIPKISARLERKPLIMTLRTRPILALLIAFLILFALSGAVYALGKAFGYIPGVGVVDQSAPIRLLAEPVTVKQQGISVTVSRVVADSTRTFITYRVDGIPLVENQTPACVNMPELHLPDGTNLENRTGSGGNAVLRNGDSLYYVADGVYAPIPSGGNQAILMLSCLFPDGRDSQNFELTLNLVPAPAGYATPAVEIAVTADGSEHQTGLHLQKVLELENSYILIGKFTDGGDLNGRLYMTTSSDSDYLPHIEDVNGNPVPFKVREDARPEPDWDVAYYWAYEVPKPVAAPLRITIDQVETWKRNTTPMQFDAGEHPQVGQVWNLNQTIKLGASDFVVDSVTFLGNGYRFDLSSQNFPEGTTPNIEILDRSLALYQFDSINSTVDNGGSTALIMLSLTTNSTPPTGNLTVNWWLDENSPQPGPWTLVWSPSITKP